MFHTPVYTITLVIGSFILRLKKLPPFIYARNFVFYFDISEDKTYALVLDAYY